MKTFLKKLRHILPAYLAIAFGSALFLAQVRWLICIQFPILDINEEIWLFWLPLLFPWIPITLWLRQRLRILTFGDNDRGRFAFQMIAWGGIAMLLFNSQALLTTATGKLETLRNISEIENTPKVRYYRIRDFAVAHYMGSSYSDIRTTGKHNETLNFTVYFTAPLLIDATQKIYAIPKFWYGVQYSDHISNRISAEQKEEKFNAFYAECLDKINQYDFHDLDHFERLPNSDDRKFYLRAVENRTKVPHEGKIAVLRPVKESYENRNDGSLFWTMASLFTGPLIMVFSILFPGFSESEQKRFTLGYKRKKDDEFLEMLKFLIPKGNHFVTSVLINANLLVFLAMVLTGVNLFSPTGSELMEWGANRRMETTGGEWWRLFTSMFLHGGLMHLLLNVYGLVIAGLYLEPMLGRMNILLLYILAGLLASLASIEWYTNTISVGASGAIFGLYGAILALLLTDVIDRNENRIMLIMAGVFVGINLLYGLMGGIDNAAHIGGLISGGFIGIMLHALKSD